MSQAKLLFQQGRLNEAIDELTREVKAAPNDIASRTFLFELLCFAGEWDRAERQLDVIGHQSNQAKVGADIYRQNIKAERDRARLFSDAVSPHFLIQPPAYIELWLGAASGLLSRTTHETRKLLDRAEEERPALSGKINGVAFQDLKDCDERTGPVLEIFVQEKYTWLPFEQISRIDIAEPRNLRDLLWATARIQVLDGTMAQVYIPALYAGSNNHSNDEVRLGRRTEWYLYRNGLLSGVGSRLLLLDEEERSILDVRTIEFEHNHAADPVDVADEQEVSIN
jgi:type VI secretion system protein ImpE